MVLRERSLALVRALVLVALVAGVATTSRAAPASPPLGGRCLMMAGAGHAACRVHAPSPTPSLLGQPGAATAPTAPPTVEHFGFADFAGAYSIYRLLSATEDQRRCRLQPTCSLFAARAARQLGLLRGLMMGFARAQMSHTDQDGLLPRAVATDGKFIYLDPVERWLHGAL